MICLLRIWIRVELSTGGRVGVRRLEQHGRGGEERGGPCCCCRGSGSEDGGGYRRWRRTGRFRRNGRAAGSNGERKPRGHLRRLVSCNFDATSLACGGCEELGWGFRQNGLIAWLARFGFFVGVCRTCAGASGTPRLFCEQSANTIELRGFLAGRMPSLSRSNRNSGSGLTQFTAGYRFRSTNSGPTAGP